MKSALKPLSIFHKNKSLSKGSDNMTSVGDGGRREGKKRRTERNHPPKANKPSFLTSDTEETGFSVLLQSTFLSCLVFCFLPWLILIASEEGRKTNRIHIAKYTLEGRGGGIFLMPLGD